MTRLFTAFVPPPHAIEHLAASVPEISGGPRATPRDSWHITIGFYGEDDVVERSRLLHERVKNLVAPRLSLGGAGTFPQVCWIGVRTPDTDALLKIAAAADASLGGRTDFTPHLTIARGAGGDALADDLSDYEGPQWTPETLGLFSSERGANGPIYTRVDQVTLR